MDRQIYTNSVLDAVEETAVDALIESKAIGQNSTAPLETFYGAG